MYGNEAVIPAEVGLTSYRVHNHDESRNDEAICLQLDLVDEVRATTEQRLVRYQDHMAKHYNSRVRHRDFKVGDLFLRKVMGATRDPTQGKLGLGRGRTLTTQRRQTDRSCHIHGTPSTCRNTTNKKDDMKSSTPLFLVYLSEFQLYSLVSLFTLIFATITFSKPKGQVFVFFLKNYFFLQMHGDKRILFKNS